MANDDQSDESILSKIGLNDADLRDLQAKFASFMASLNEAQAKVVSRNLSTSAEAAATLGPEVTPEALEAFLRRRTEGPDSMVLFMEQCGEDE